MNSLADRILGQKHAVEILLMIREGGEVMLSDLDRTGWTTTNKRLTELESFGLIKYRTRTYGRSAQLWSLTELGEAVTAQLAAIEGILSEQDDPLPGTDQDDDSGITGDESDDSMTIISNP